MQTINSTKKLENLAILFDADNANPKYIGSLLKFLEKYGKVYTIRAYANWRKVACADMWNEQALIFNIEMQQMVSNRYGKNATDIHLAAEAMELVMEKLIDGVCIVSDDSDYTAVLRKCRAKKITTIVVGGENAATHLMKVCDFFIDERTLELENPHVHVNSQTDEKPAQQLMGTSKELPQRRPREMKKLDKKILKKLRTRVKRK